MSDDPIRPELRESMNHMAAAIDRIFNPDPANRRLGFALLVFDFGGQGFMNYISNAERDDMLRAMGEFIARNGIERGQH